MSECKPEICLLMTTMTHRLYKRVTLTSVADADCYNRIDDSVNKCLKSVPHDSVKQITQVRVTSTPIRSDNVRPRQD